MCASVPKSCGDVERYMPGFHVCASVHVNAIFPWARWTTLFLKPGRKSSGRGGAAGRRAGPERPGKWAPAHCSPWLFPRLPCLQACQLVLGLPVEGVGGRMSNAAASSPRRGMDSARRRGVGGPCGAPYPAFQELRTNVRGAAGPQKGGERAARSCGSAPWGSGRPHLRSPARSVARFFVSRFRWITPRAACERATPLARRPPSVRPSPHPRLLLRSSAHDSRPAGRSDNPPPLPKPHYLQTLGAGPPAPPWSAATT